MSNTRYGEGSYSEVTCARSVVGAAFGSGIADYNWTIGRPNVFIPSESYFICDMTLTYNNRQPFLSDEIALGNDPCSSLFNNAYMKCGGQDVSSITSFLPQASVIKNRLTKPYAWRNSVGQSAYALESNFLERCKKVSRDGEMDFTTASILNIVAGTSPGVSVNVSGAVGGTSVDFTLLDPATDWLVVNGYRLKLKTVVNALSATVEVTPKLATYPILTTEDFKFYRQKADYSVGNNRVYVVWKPCLGFFDVTTPMGSGDYRISLNPDSNYKTAAIESLLPLTVGVGLGQFDLVINDLKFYAATYKYDIPNSIQDMGLKEYMVQSKTLTGGTEQLQFSVPPSTIGLGFFLQESSAGSNTTKSPTVFKLINNEENTLSSYQITYANVTKPSTRFSGIIEVNGLYPNQVSKNTVQQRYHDTFCESGLISSDGGCESLQQYLESGQFVYTKFIRDGENRSTQVQLSVTTGSVGFTNNTKIYLVAIYHRQVQVSSSEGLVVSVRSLSV